MKESRKINSGRRQESQYSTVSKKASEDLKKVHVVHTNAPIDLQKNSFRRFNSGIRC